MTLHPQSGIYLSAVRQAKGFTQGKLAFNIGVKQSTISHYENGLRRLTDTTAATVALALGVDPRLLHTNEPLIPGLPQSVEIEGHEFQVMLKRIEKEQE